MNPTAQYFLPRIPSLPHIVTAFYPNLIGGDETGEKLIDKTIRFRVKKLATFRECTVLDYGTSRRR